MDLGLPTNIADFWEFGEFGNCRLELFPGAAGHDESSADQFSYFREFGSFSLLGGTGESGSITGV